MRIVLESTGQGKCPLLSSKFRNPTFLRATPTSASEAPAPSIAAGLLPVILYAIAAVFRSSVSLVRLMAAAIFPDSRRSFCRRTTIPFRKSFAFRWDDPAEPTDRTDPTDRPDRATILFRPPNSFPALLCPAEAVNTAEPANPFNAVEIVDVEVEEAVIAEEGVVAAFAISPKEQAISKRKVLAAKGFFIKRNGIYGIFIIISSAGRRLASCGRFRQGPHS